MSEAYTLVIVESPSKCKKIEQYLNKHHTGTIRPYKCLASYGHIRELAGLESIDIHNNFAPTFIECVSKKEQISKLRKAVKGAAEVILASDDDREGEAIAWHLSQVLKLPIESTKRILFHEITESALHQAVDKPTLINMQLVNAQMARQVLDLLVGYKLSPLLWRHVKDGLSAGRCQTPALRLIYENEKDIQSAPGKQSYTITGYFTNANIPFVLNHEETDPERLQEFLQASLTHPYMYNGTKLQTKTRQAPDPFSTSSLQQHCSNEMHLSPKETMSVCQTLYEGGYITYHRTDSKVYSEEFKEKAAVYIVKTYGGDPHTPLLGASPAPNLKEKRGKKGSALTKKGGEKLSQEGGGAGGGPQPHEAIRITNLECKMIEYAVTNKKESRVYQLIRQRTLESLMPAAIISLLTATISAPQQHEYHYTTEQVIYPGWKIVSESLEKNEGKNYAYLQSMKPNMQIPSQKIKANLHLKELKSHYSEARLVQLLEEKGIGRPSTFASLIDKIQERKYVKKDNVKGKLISCIDYEINDGQLIKITAEKEFGNEKNKLVITPVGTLALEFLLNHFEDFFQYAYTKEMEDALDAVAKGEKIWYEVCKECYTELEHLSSTILEKGKETIRIDANHTYMIGKYGPVIKVGGNPPNPPSGESQTALHKKNNKRGSVIQEEKGLYPNGGSGGVTPLFKAVRSDIDLNKLRRGEYTIDDIVDKKDAASSSIGLYMEKPVYIKVGKFGKYLEWNDVKKSLKHLKQAPNEITLDDVVEMLFDMDNNESSQKNLRIISEDASICKSKFGHYIFYKNKKMKKPRFLKLDGFSGDYLNCEITFLQEWFKTTYKIDTL